jgi:branched-chain amino acid transport system permease protein
MTAPFLKGSTLTKLVLGVFILFMLLIPTFVDNRFVLTILITICFAIINTCAYNLLLGYTGMMSFGQSAFYAIGGYASAILTIRLAEMWPDAVVWPLGLILAGLLSALCAWGIGALLLKLKGAYFVMVTFAFAMLVMKLIENLEGLTGGVFGLRGVPKLFPDITWIYIFMVVLTVIVYFIIYRIANSQYGRILVSIREDENVAKSAGVNVFRYKMAAFIVSSVITGVTGAVFAHYLRIVEPNIFAGFGVSVTMFTATVVGGSGYLVGPGVAAAFFAFLPEILRGVGEYNLLVNGIILVVAIIFIPGGFEPYFRSLYYKMRYSKLLLRKQG